MNDNFKAAQNPPGTIVAYGGDPAHLPAGWLLCDGAPIDRTMFADLFTAIGTTWGFAGQPALQCPRPTRTLPSRSWWPRSRMCDAPKSRNGRSRGGVFRGNCPSRRDLVSYTRRGRSRSRIRSARYAGEHIGHLQFERGNCPIYLPAWWRHRIATEKCGRGFYHQNLARSLPVVFRATWTPPPVAYAVTRRELSARCTSDCSFSR